MAKSVALGYMAPPVEDAVYYGRLSTDCVKSHERGTLSANYLWMCSVSHTMAPTWKPRLSSIELMKEDDSRAEYAATFSIGISTGDL